MKAFRQADGGVSLFRPGETSSGSIFGEAHEHARSA